MPACVFVEAFLGNCVTRLCALLFFGYPQPLGPVSLPGSQRLYNSSMLTDVERSQQTRLTSENVCVPTKHLRHCFTLPFVFNCLGGRRVWQKPEQAAVKKHMLSFIVQSQLPRRDDIVPWLVNEPSLTGRSWKNVKDFVRNCITSNSRRHTD
jgi:hypothetical protein